MYFVTLPTIEREDIHKPVSLNPAHIVSIEERGGEHSIVHCMNGRAYVVPLPRSAVLSRIKQANTRDTL